MKKVLITFGLMLFLTSFAYSNETKCADFKKLVKKSNFKIFDMRNMYSPSKMKNLKIKYFGIGR